MTIKRHTGVLCGCLQWVLGEKSWIIIPFRLRSACWEKSADDILKYFSSFSQKQCLTIHENCLPRRQFSWIFKACFLEKKIRKLSADCRLLNLPREWVKVKIQASLQQFSYMYLLIIKLWHMATLGRKEMKPPHYTCISLKRLIFWVKFSADDILK